MNQIKELTNTIHLNYDCSLEFSKGLAEFLFDEGYRKVLEGKWIKTKEWYFDEYAQSSYQRDRYKCSVCGRTEQHREPYCHCGTKMDKETEN